MGSNNASTGGGGGGVGPAGLITNKKTGETKYGEVKDAKKVSTRNELRTFVKEGGVTGAIIKGLTKGEEVNRKFFEEKVKPANKSKYSNYEDYIKARGRGEVDAYGREIISTGNDNQVVQAPPVATTMPTGTPTAVEISQSEATKAEDPILLRKRKAKARGRTPTIMTGVTGATGSLTLGKPSLLGR